MYKGNKRRGMMIVLSSPSGAGKTTLTRKLIAKDVFLKLSVSVTTRSPRAGEREGIDYHFVSTQEFDNLRHQDELLEYAQVFNHYYGTPRALVEHSLQEGQDILFDIDWQGAQQLTQKAGDDVVKIFILPPDLSALEERLHTRAQDSKEVIVQRMAKSEIEISHWAEYDYVLVNDDLEATFTDLEKIISAERLRRSRQPWLDGFTKRLMGQA